MTVTFAFVDEILIPFGQNFCIRLLLYCIYCVFILFFKLAQYGLQPIFCHISKNKCYYQGSMLKYVFFLNYELLTLQRVLKNDIVIELFIYTLN